ncbi:MAG: hypothetical protein ACRDPK_19675 [Carbonactinosporaceae bacterium]
MSDAPGPPWPDRPAHGESREAVERMAAQLTAALHDAGLPRVARLVMVTTSVFGTPRIQLVPLRLDEVQELVTTLRMITRRARGEAEP